MYLFNRNGFLCCSKMSGFDCGLQQLNEATSLLRATCDTFISSLDECMQLVNSSSGSSGPNTPTSTALVTPPIKNNSRVSYM